MIHDPAIHDLAIVGGGFSGVALLAALSRQAPDRRVLIFDPNPQLPAGIAFAEAAPWHRLNVQAENMSVLADQPDDFVNYLATCRNVTQSAASPHDLPETDHCSIASEYASRADYANYLRNHLHQAVRLIESAGGSVTHVQNSVTLIHQSTHGCLNIQADEGTFAARHAVLALGAKSAEPALCSPNFHSGPWRIKQLPSHTDADEAVIIGSGLTGVDSVQTLMQLGWRGKIRMLSTHARLPEVHRRVSDWRLSDDFSAQCVDVRHTLRAVRHEIRLAVSAGLHWQDVFQAFRPITSGLFANWCASERVKFIRRLMPLWGVHRHRMAPDVYAQLTVLFDSQKLSICAGRVTSVVDAGQHIVVNHVGAQHAASVVSIPAKLVIDARQAGWQVKRHHLIANLAKAGLIGIDASQLAVQCDQHGCASGFAANRLFAVGLLRYGALLESVAVPEIRQQVAAVVGQLLK